MAPKLIKANLFIISVPLRKQSPWKKRDHLCSMLVLVVFRAYHLIRTPDLGAYNNPPHLQRQWITHYLVLACRWAGVLLALQVVLVYKCTLAAAASVCGVMRRCLSDSLSYIWTMIVLSMLAWIYLLNTFLLDNNRATVIHSLVLKCYDGKLMLSWWRFVAFPS